MFALPAPYQSNKQLVRNKQLAETISSLKCCFLVIMATIIIGTSAKALAYVPTPVVLHQEKDAKAEQARAKKQLEQLQKDIQASRKQVEQGQQKLSRAERNIRQIEQKIDRTTKQIIETEQALSHIQARIVKLEQDQKQLELKLKKQATLLADQIEAAYRSGDHHFLKLLLNQNNPAQLERQLAYYKHLNEARLEQLHALHETEKELQQLQQKIQDEQQELSQRKKQQVAQENQLRQQKQAQEQQVAALQASQQKTEQRLKQQLQSEQELAELLAALAKVLAQQPVQLAGLSKLRAQLPWPTSGKIKHNFGDRRSNQSTWQGLVFDVNTQAKVQSIADGRVVFSDWLRGYGLVLVLDHGDHYMSLYGYNQSLLYEVGQQIKQGQIIAYAGQSGGQKEPALYFEIRHKGVPVNPHTYFKAR